MAFAALAHSGDNIVSTSNLYGGTYNQLKVFLPRLGITTKFVKGDDPKEFAKLIDDKTKAVYLESIGNPRYNVPDFEKIVEVAHEKGVPVVVSSCCSPYLQLSAICEKAKPARLIIHLALEGTFAGQLITVPTLLFIPQPSGLEDMAQPLAE